MYTNPVSKSNRGWLWKGSAQLQVPFACAATGTERANQVTLRGDAAERPLECTFLHLPTQGPPLGSQIYPQLGLKCQRSHGLVPEGKALGHLAAVLGSTPGVQGDGRGTSCPCPVPAAAEMLRLGDAVGKQRLHVM